MPLLRPRDADALRAEMRHVASVAGVPVMFGGEVHDDTLLLTEFLGTRTAGLRGLAVRPSAGLGGATVVARRPMSVADYRKASTITHDYDGPVLGEGIRSILAVPAVVDGRARAVLYGAYHRAAPVGDRTVDVMVASARRLSSTSSVSATRLTGVCGCGRHSWRILATPWQAPSRSARCTPSCAGSRRILRPVCAINCSSWPTGWAERYPAMHRRSPRR